VRALLFVEALALVAMAAVFPLLAGDLASAFLAPMAVALILPICASFAVQPLDELRAAFSSALKGRRPSGTAGRATALIERFASFALYGGVLGFLASVVAALQRVGRGVGAGHWLLLGAFWLFYAMILAEASAVLRAVVLRLGLPPANADARDAAARAFAESYGLSPREWEVAARIVEGQSYKETAEGLFISIKTVKTHISNVYRKTGTGDKVSLLLLLREEIGKGKVE
jgi:DNA-binding CsgD family transcriptional regulator